MARLHARIQAFSGLVDIDAAASATIKFYAAGTGAVAVSGLTTTGTPFAGNLYVAATGGSPISTTQTADARGGVVVYTDSKLRYDVGIEVTGASAGAQVYANESFELDPGDVVTFNDDEQVLGNPGTSALPGYTFAGDPDTGLSAEVANRPILSAGAIKVLEILATATTLRSPNGTTTFTLNNDGTFTAPYFMRTLSLYNLETYGVIFDDSTTGVKASNAAALNALPATMSATAGGKAVAKAGSIHTNAVDWGHNASFNCPLWLEGVEGNTYLKLYGTTGPFFDIAPTSADLIARGGLKNLIVFNEGIPISGATIRMTFVSDFVMENVYLLTQAGGLAPLIGVQMAGTASGLNMRHCKVQTRNDSATLTAGGLVPISLDIATGVAAGLVIEGSDLSGCAGISNGIRFNNSGVFDTIHISGTTVKDHLVGISAGLGAGDPVNLTMLGGYIDGCTVDVDVQPAAGANYIGWIFQGVWMSCSTSNVRLSTANGGTVTRFKFSGGFALNATVSAFLLQGGLDTVSIHDVDCYTEISDPSGIGIYAVASGGSSPSNLRVLDNTIRVISTAGDSVNIGSGVTPFHFGGGVVRGKLPTFGGVLSSARVVTDFAYAP